LYLFSIYCVCIKSFYYRSSPSQDHSKKATPPSIAPCLKKVNPAGIQARQLQLVQGEKWKEYEEKVNQPISQALKILCKHCVMCWMNNREGWEGHLSDNCPIGIGTNKKDPNFTHFRKKAFCLPAGWCWFCHTHQI
jgi:hypothetical protein